MGRAIAALPLLWMAMCLGCDSGPRPQHIFGTITFDGQPVENGTLELIPLPGTGGPSMGSAIVSGRFAVPAAKGPRAGGQYKVVITALRDSGKTVPNMLESGGKPMPVGEQFVPPRYNSESELSITVSADASQNEHTFRLEAEARKPGS